MTDKERLENMSPVGFDLDGNVLLKSEDYHWLIEQAEKADKYESVLEFYANEKNHEYEITYDMADVIESPVMKDGGDLARKVLGCEE